MYDLGLRGNLPIFIENFLSSREFSVRVGSSHSDYVKQTEGLPQGSILSVTCFAIAINDIPRQLSTEVQSTLYVDDFTIFTSAVNTNHSNRIIQTSINRLQDWTKTRGMRFSSEKTVAIKFEKRKKEGEPIITLNNKRIKICESTLYLGLVVDKRLNWRSHVEHLRAKCIPAVNLLKHLSHLSWGADRQTLLHLYTALIKSKLDYGAQVYGTPETKALDSLNPIQNESLRACMGAFKSSPAVSLCVEAGVPPLKYSRDIISLNFFFKTASQQTSPTHLALVGSPQTGRTSKREQIDTLLTHYQINAPKMCNISPSETPPWKYTSTKMCPYIDTTKANRPSEEVRSDFLSHLEVHPTIHIYTDGSKMDQCVGYAAVAGNRVSCGSLPKEASIFTAELYAIKTAINEIVETGAEGDQFTIFSDSRSALQALKRDTTRSPVVMEIKELIYRLETRNIGLEMCWVPGHTNISGNEKADAAAKDAAAAAPLAHTKPIPYSDMKRPVREAILKKWQEDWNSLNQKGRKLREMKRG